ncbi:unnamed protein product [Dibothriocephalus latus]|uniref:Uncharacterized protein n=1 Tax=Dibothriocephalus latus TaxID=60516 RepID=A0A3P6S868_DIBLA|nr:unnamed protein product [Dibothriocephalus latus]
MEEHSETVDVPAEAEPSLEASSPGTPKNEPPNDGLQCGEVSEEPCGTSSGEGEQQDAGSANEAPLNNLENTDEHEPLHATADCDSSLPETSMGVEDSQDHACVEVSAEVEDLQPTSLDQTTNDQDEPVTTSTAYESAETHVQNGYTVEEGTNDTAQAELSQANPHSNENNEVLGSEAAVGGDSGETAAYDNGERDDSELPTHQDKEEPEMGDAETSSTKSQNSSSLCVDASSPADAPESMHAEESQDTCCNEPVEHNESVQENDVTMISESQVESLVPSQVENVCEQPQVTQDDQRVTTEEKQPIKPNEYPEINCQDSVSQTSEDRVAAQPCTEMPDKIADYVQSKDYSPDVEQQNKEDEKVETSSLKAEPAEVLLAEKKTSGKEDFEARYAEFVGRILPGHDVYHAEREQELPRGGTLHRHADAHSPYAVLWDTSNVSVRAKAATLVDKTLVEPQTAEDSAAKYDVPFMDDEAFLPHRMRSNRGQEEDAYSDSDSDYESGEFGKGLLEKDHLAHLEEASTHSSKSAVC